MHCLNWKPLFVMMISLFLCHGCRGTGEEKRLDIKVSNLGSNDINKAEVWFDKNRCGAGVLGPGGGATHMYFEKPITAKATVKWVDSKGAKQERTVEVSKVYDGKSKSGVLSFEIGDNGVSVRFDPLK